MHTDAEHVIVSGMDDPDVFNSLRGLNEHCGTRAFADSDFPKTAKGILIATPISLSLWALIILALSKLF